MTSHITLAKESGPAPVRTGLRGHPWFTLFAVAIGVMMVTLDGTIVAVANPAIQKDLGASLAEVQWITNGYLLALAVSLITGRQARRPLRTPPDLPHGHGQASPSPRRRSASPPASARSSASASPRASSVPC